MVVPGENQHAHERPKMIDNPQLGPANGCPWNKWTCSKAAQVIWNILKWDVVVQGQMEHARVLLNWSFRCLKVGPRN